MCELLGMNCEQRGCRLFHDPAPSAHSPMAHFLQTFPIKSKNVVAHIRKARAGINLILQRWIEPT